MRWISLFLILLPSGSFRLSPAAPIFDAAARVEGAVPYSHRLFAQGTPTDDRIYDNVRRKLATDRDVGAEPITVTVKDGVVTMKGVVKNNKVRSKAARIAKKVKGVTKVDNQLQIK